jgi:large subunit ribosomal protein L4
VWRGGGVAHGPKPRDFEQKLNKKVWKLAFKRALSEKIVAGEIIVVSEFKFEAPKTKLMAALLKNLGVTRSALVIQKEVDDTTLLVTSNLPRVDYSTAQALDVYTLMANKTVVCDQAGFDALMARMAK